MILEFFLVNGYMLDRCVMVAFSFCFFFPFSVKRCNDFLFNWELVDDTMAILMAFQTPELEILGLTTIFGNVTTEDATRNALLLVCVPVPADSIRVLKFW